MHLFPQLFPFPPNTAHSPLYCLSTADDRTNQPPHTDNIGSSQQTHTNPVTPTSTTKVAAATITLRSHLATVMTLFAFVIVQPPQLHTHLELELTLCAHPVFVGCQKYGDKVKAGATLLDVMRGMYRQPTTDLLLSRLTSFLPTFACLPVHLYIFFVAYERAIPLRVFPSSVPHPQTFRLSSWYLMRLLVTCMCLWS